MIQFYSPDILETLCLPESDSAHCCRVLRMSAGDKIQVVDGKGMRYLCEITEAHPKHTYVEIISSEKLPNHWSVKITLAVAPTKHSDRMEWMLEKVVELGIDKVVLLRCARSERKAIKVERLEKVMISAMKQSLKGVLPIIEEVTSFKKFIDSVAENDQKFFGYCSDEVERNEFVKCLASGSDVVVMIGPEGDFSPEEVEYAMMRGFVPVTFGKSRLRTETAAMFAVTAVHVVNQING